MVELISAFVSGSIMIFSEHFGNTLQYSLLYFIKLLLLLNGSGLMQEFMEDGNLYPGIHAYSVEDFEQQFVADFTSSSTRNEIYKNLTSVA